MNELINKNAILIRLEIERTAFDSIVDQVDPELLDTLPVQDDRTVKDILAHICSWELELLRWLEMAEHGTPPDIPAPGTWSDYTDQFNAAKYEENRHRTITDVKEEYEQVHTKLRHSLSALPDDPHDPAPLPGVTCVPDPDNRAGEHGPLDDQQGRTKHGQRIGQDEQAKVLDQQRHERHHE